MQYRHIIWDWNGTIVDDVALAIEIGNGFLRTAGLPELDRELHCRSFQIPIEHYYRALGLQFNAEQLHALDESFHAQYEENRHRLQAFSDVIDMLQFAGRNGISSSVLSALPSPILFDDLEHLGLKPHFSTVIGRASRLAGSKVEQGRILLKDLGVPAQQVLVIGDTTYDAEVAHTLGADCALISRGHHDEARLRATRPRYLAPNVAELVEKIGRET